MQAQGEVAGTTTEPQLQIKQDITSPNPKDHTICVKMVLPKQPFGRIFKDSQLRKSNKLAQIDKKEKEIDPNMRFRVEEYKRLRQSREDFRRPQPEVIKTYQAMESNYHAKEKFSYSLWEPFTNRGKHPHIKFTFTKNKNPQENILTIFFNKRYYLEELKMSRNYLLTIPATFVSTWTQDFLGMLKVINKILQGGQKSQGGEKTQTTPSYTFFLRSLDLISFTFDVNYQDKKTYRFRYSPFEFRNTLFFKQAYQLVGYNQCISVIPQINNKGYLTDQEFYLAPRCFIFDDLTDSNMFTKILQRTNIFYTTYLISRCITSGLDTEQYSKKCLWQFYFSTTRLKKFIFTWSFRPFKRVTNRNEHVVKEIQLQSKQIIFHIPFYVQTRQVTRDPKDDISYRIRVQYQDFNKNIPQHVKDEIIRYVKQWYTFFKETKDRTIERSREKPERQQTELQMLFTSKDRFDKFLLGMLVVVSTLIDRNYFNMLEDRWAKQSKQIRQMQEYTPQIVYVNKKHEIMKHFHWLEIHFEHKIFHYIFHKLPPRTAEKSAEYKYKCGQWKVAKLNKCKREWHLKDKKQVSEFKAVEVLSFPDIFYNYINALLRHFSLKFIYKDIVNFVAGVSRNCYNGWQENNSFDKIIRNQAIFKAIVAVLMDFQYKTQNKEKQQKPKNQEKPQQQQKYIQEQKYKKEDRSNQNIFKKDDRSSQSIFKIQQNKVVVLKILTKGDPSFMSEQKLLAQVTFRIMEYRGCWITRMNDGFVLLRVFDDRIDFQRQYEKVDTLKFNSKNRNDPFEEKDLKQKLQKLSSQIKTSFLS